MQVAIRSFTDESDGSWVEKGKTLVSESSDVFRAHPECFKPSHRSPTRLAPDVTSASRQRKRKRRPTRTNQRPSWMLGQNEPWRLGY
jgi:hypothetical protein